MAVSPADFVHLHVHTEYSLLDGASRIKDLVSAAKEAGMEALAITDHGNMYGAVTFYQECRKQGIKPVIGCEVYLAPGDRHERADVKGVRYHHLILLAENETGYRNLTKLVSLGNIEGYYYKPRIDKEILRQYHEGLICLSACIIGEIPRAIINGDMEKADELTREYIDIFGPENFFLEVQDHGLEDERKAREGLLYLAEKYSLKLVATNDLHYVRREDASYHDILLCIQTGATVNEPGRMKFSSDDFYLKNVAEMEKLFPPDVYKDALTNTKLIADRCQVDFVFGEHYLPQFPLPEGLTDEQYLRQLCEEKITGRYDPVTKEVRERLEYELDVIHRMGFDSYFLIVWDFINHAREQGIAVGPGRGSAAGSIVAYTLGITDIDPLRYALLFERFLNPERVSMPDIDVDFCYIRRGEVIDYVKERYGEDHVAQIITFGTMLARGAVRDVGRALDLPYGDVDRIAKLIPAELGMTLAKAMKESAEFRQLYDSNPEAKQVIDYAMAVEGLPRHSSTHAAGVVIAGRPLTDYLPVQLSDGTLVTQYDKDLVERLGLLKMDFLGLRTLTVIADALENIYHSRGERVDIGKIPLEDELTGKMLCDGQTSAVFQMESTGMTQLVKDLAPTSFEDLIPLVALYRPGPLGSGMVKDFIDGRHGKKVAEYPHPLLEPILKETFGVILYQEQVMQIVQVLAGFSLGQADLLRRAMGHKEPELLMKQKATFLEGAKARNVDPKIAEHIFELLTHFADYGFNKSHSAAYALVAWRTAYLKAHYPAEFMAAMLSSVVDSSDKVGVYIEQCRRMGIPILPPDINASNASFSVDGNAIRFGLSAVKNVGDGAIAEIKEKEKADGPYTSLEDFCSRVDMRTVNKRVIESLVKCGAFDSLGAYRSQLLAILPDAASQGAYHQKDLESGQLGLFGEEENLMAIPLPNIDEVPIEERLTWEKEITGFYITGHPLDAYKRKIESFFGIGRILNGELPEKARVRVAGIVTQAKRSTTKKGDTMCFLTVEDFTHSIEVVVFPKVFYEHMDELVPESMVVITGRVDASETGTKLLADEVSSLEDYHPTYFLTVEPKAATANTQKDILNILSKHPGPHPVRFFLKAQNRHVKAEPKYSADDSPELMEELEAILGKGNVVWR